MQLVKRSLLALLLILFFTLFSAYFFLQTDWGARKLTQWLSGMTKWHLSLRNIEHAFSRPSHLILRGFTFGRDGQPAMVVAETVDLKLSLAQFNRWRHFDMITLSQGEINLALLNNEEQWPVETDFLQLKSIKINHPNHLFPFKASQITGGIAPWKPEGGNFLGATARFKMSIGKLDAGALPFEQVLIEGDIRNYALTLTKIGANLAHGAITGSAKRNTQGEWTFDKLRINGVRLQMPHKLQDIVSRIDALPAIAIKQVDMTDMRLQGDDWAVSDLALSLKNLSLQQRRWQSINGSLVVNASDLIYRDTHISNPFVDARFTNEAVTLNTINLRWANGVVRASGRWLRESKQLLLDELIAAGMEITLPESWRDVWISTLPNWLNRIEIRKFSLNRNLLIDIDEKFPFQLTALNGSGKQVVFADRHRWGFWSGDMNLNAAGATFNRTDLRQPSLQISADAQRIAITEFSAITDTDGLLEGKATIGQQAARLLTLSLQGRSVDANILHNWGWPLLPMAGITDQQLTLTTHIQTGESFRENAYGSLKVTKENDVLQQEMGKGRIQSSVCNHAKNH